MPIQEHTGASPTDEHWRASVEDYKIISHNADIRISSSISVVDTAPSANSLIISSRV
jgi:hypothetical protein